MRFEILVYHGFDELDAIAPSEVLRQAARKGADFHVDLVSTGEEEIEAANGLRLRVGGRLGGSGKPEVIVVPGGGWIDRAPRGSWAEAQKGVIPAEIKRLDAQGVKVASVCTGAMLWKT